MGVRQTQLPGGGTLLAKRYRVDAAIASGGSGTVFRASHLALGHDVAVKVLHERSIHEDSLRRFAREARLAAELGELSRHVARVTDYGVEAGRPFLVMELLRGEDLRERLEREPCLSPALVVEIVAQLCDGLEVAHDRGVLHRDIKPANVYLARVGTHKRPELVVKLMDFGVATSLAEVTLRNGLVLGTPAFMSPEQIQGLPLDARSDLWAVGALVYRMLTGVTPFGVGAAAEVGARIVDEDHDPPSAVASRLPRALDVWMARALAKDPRERFASATELALSLEATLAETRPKFPALRAERSGVRAVDETDRAFGRYPWIWPALFVLTSLALVLWLRR